MTEEARISHWIQDNLRIIISIGIVILLVFAIYSYSKRNSNPVIVDEMQSDESIVDTNKDSTEINEIIDEIKDEEQQSATDVAIDTSATSDQQDSTISDAQTMPEKATEVAQQSSSQEQDETQQQEPPAAENTQTTESAQALKEEEKKLSPTEVVQEVISSQQKSGTITVTAALGDSATTLARKAAKQYMSQQNITDLTAAHKIYIEDYLRRMKNARGIHPGTTFEFSAAEISDAIAHARQLNTAQLTHLNSYAQHVTNL